MLQSSTATLSGIFVCYRRGHSSGHAGRLFDNLAQHFGEARIFIDVEVIRPGVDFVKAIQETLDSCDILIAVIGVNWLASDGKGSQLLDNPDDFVRFEITKAIELGVSIVPVLVQGASMPKSRDLPQSISGLSHLNAIEISDLRWRHDINQLVRSLERILADRQDLKKNAFEETRQRNEKHAIEERLKRQEQSRREAEEELRQLNEEAEVRAEQEQQLKLAVGILREQENEHVKRVEELHAQLAATVKACYVAETEAQQHADRAELVDFELENALKNKEDYVKLWEEAESQLRALEEFRNGAQVSTSRRAEREQQLNTEIEALKRAEEGQIKRIEMAEARLREQQEARQSARARVKELAEQETRIIDEIEELRKAEEEHLNRINRTEESHAAEPKDESSYSKE